MATCHFLERVPRWRAGLPGRVVMIWDNAPCHIARMVQGHSVELGIELVALPGYNSPDLNPIERLWDWMREEVTRGHCHATLAELRSACLAFVARTVDGSISGSSNPDETGHITRVNFTNCTATAAANNGFYFRGCGRINLTGCSAFINGTHGVRVDHPVVHLSINGGQYFGNSTWTPGTHDGIYFGPNVTDFLVANVKAGLAPGEKQRFGINASSPTNNRYLITGCEAIGYPSGGINAQGGPNKVVANNLG